MAEGHNAIQSVEDNARVDHFVVVELTQIFNLGDTSLVESEIVLLKAKCDVFKHIVNDSDREFLMVAVESAQ